MRYRDGAPGSFKIEAPFPDKKLNPEWSLPLRVYYLIKTTEQRKAYNITLCLFSIRLIFISGM